MMKLKSLCLLILLLLILIDIPFELVKDKYHERVWVESERLSDYSITYKSSDLSNDAKIILDRYRIIYVN